MGCGASAEPGQVPDKYTPAPAETESSPGDCNAAAQQPEPEKAAVAADSTGGHATGTQAEQTEACPILQQKEATIAVEPAAQTTDAGWATVVCEDGRQYCESLLLRDDGC